MQENKELLDWTKLHGEEEINIREVIGKYLRYWKWFVVCMLLTGVLAKLYLRYTPPIFKVEATILIHDREKDGGISELSAFKDLDLDNNTSSFDTELGVLKSRNLMEKVVRLLELQVRHYSKGNIREMELYGEKRSLKVHFLGKDSLVPQKNIRLYMRATSKETFEMLDVELQTQGEFRFGENITHNNVSFTVTPSATSDLQINQIILVQVQPVLSVAANYKSRIQITPVDKKSSLVTVSLQDIVSQKANDIINALVSEYNIENINDKNLIAKNTAEFIELRLATISSELSFVDADIERFKTSNSLTDISSESHLMLNSSSEISREIIKINTQLKLVKYVQEHLKNNDVDLIPSNLGLEDINLHQSTLLYNTIFLERNRLLESSSSLNPVLINLDNKIEKLKMSIEQGLVNLKSSYEIALKDIKGEETTLNSKIREVPKQEREFRDILRQQEIIESLYLYLLQKREENAISMAVTTPNAKMIDTPYGSTIPVAPVRNKIYLIALIIGMAVPFAGIFIALLFDNKIRRLDEVETETGIPILGEIPFLKQQKNTNFYEADSAAAIEVYNALRANVLFMLSKQKESSKVVFLSSTIMGEGKTFTAVNLAKSMGLAAKKVLLINADIRNTKVPKLLKDKSRLGLTHFLMDTTLDPEAVIAHHEALNIDIIQSGMIQQNPTELLMTHRFNELISYAKDHYDIIIVDTAPVGIIPEAMLLSQNNADLFLYVVRVNYLDKKLLKVPKNFYEKNRIQNMSIVVNAVKPENTNGYGYGYGYGYGENKKSWWKRIF